MLPTLFSLASSFNYHSYKFITCTKMADFGIISFFHFSVTGLDGQVQESSKDLYWF